ncbi:MAG: glycosyltransferase family 4 protein [Bacteroidales bacterium]|jgi:glycosyltransferase involved in cell wall biosynthesis|nr:glycosyltransferase family 4 protein [Bacteroidales bacterium]
MNILIINHYAGSLDHGMEFRPWYLAKKWQEAGHKVFILSASFAHTRKKQPIVKHELQSEIVNGIEYLWLKTPKYSGNGISRILNMFSFTHKLKKHHKEIAKITAAEVVIASSTYPLDNYSAKRIANLTGGQYIYEIHDLWPLSPMELGGYSKNHPFIRIMQKAENFAYANADKVVSILPCVKTHVNQHGLPDNKLFFVPNGIWIEDWENPEQAPESHFSEIRKQKHAGKTCIAYAGAHGVANMLDSYIKAAKLSKTENFHFFLIGDGPEKSRLKTMAKKLKIDNITFLDSISKKAIPSILPEFDILYLGLKNQSLFRFGIGPNKLFDYMMAAKPIIMAINSGNDIVSDARCGYTIEPENPEKIINALKKIESLSSDEKKQMGERGKQYVIKNHEYQNLANRFLSIMEN